MNNRIGFVRHDQTDSRLTEQGCRQAKQLGEHFHRYMPPDVIYASPLQRAKNYGGLYCCQIRFIYEY